eukprot:g23768.t1
MLRNTPDTQGTQVNLALIISDPGLLDLPIDQRAQSIPIICITNGMPGATTTSTSAIYTSLLIHLEPEKLEPEEV